MTYAAPMSSLPPRGTPMLIVRPAATPDLGSLMELAILSGRGFTSLPEDADVLTERLEILLVLALQHVASLLVGGGGLRGGGVSGALLAVGL